MCIRDSCSTYRRCSDHSAENDDAFFYKRSECCEAWSGIFEDRRLVVHIFYSNDGYTVYAEIGSYCKNCDGIIKPLSYCKCSFKLYIDLWEIRNAAVGDERRCDRDAYGENDGISAFDVIFEKEGKNVKSLEIFLYACQEVDREENGNVYLLWRRCIMERDRKSVV